MKVNKILFSAGIAGMMLAASCSDEYLETRPTDSVSDAAAIGTTENAYKTLNGIARSMTTQQYAYSQGFCGENYIMNKMECYPSENYNYNYYASGWAPLLNMQWLYRTNSTYIYYAWAYYYNLIGQANTVIARIDEATGPEAERKFVKASALTFRAYSYEKLLRYYCTRWKDSNNGSAQGLILQLDETTNGKDFSTMAETYAQVYQDCQEAVELFTDAKNDGFDRASSEVWIPNLNAAHAVWARAALNKEDYATALEHSKAAQANFPLMSNADYKSGFCKPTSEWILGSYGSAEENNWYWSYGTQYSCNGYYANSQPTGAGGIDRLFINKMPNDDVRKSLFITEDKFPEFDFSYAHAAAVGDSYFATYGILGVYDDDLWDAVAAYVESMTPNGLEAAYQSGYFYLGGQLKFWVFDTPGVSYLPLIRTSEMVLVEAEANYFLNNATEAQAALVKLNGTTGRTPNYTCSKTGNELFEEIKNYRILELWGEGSEWSDYKRWKLPIERKGFAVGGNHHAATAITIKADDANNWIYATPDGELDYNDALKVNAKEE